MRNSKKLINKKAFTLIELLIVIAVIGILFVVLISKVDFTVDKAKMVGVQTDFRSYQIAIETVARENAGLSVLVNADASGEEKYAKLEKALNKNLDPKLRVEIDADGKISTGAKDPWKEQYEGQYLSPDADGTVEDRGAIVMYSKGSNLKLGTTAEIVNGVVVITAESGKEIDATDEYILTVAYTYVNGYGEIQTATKGFSNDQETMNNSSNTTPANPGGSDPSDPSDSDQDGSGGQEPVQVAAGLYDTEDNLVADWATLVDTYGLDVEKDYDWETCKTETTSPYYVLTNNSDLATGVKIKISDTVAKIGDYAFCQCTQLTSLNLGNSIESIGEMAFAYNSGLNCSLVIPNSVTSIKNMAFFNCTALTGKLVIPENVVDIGDMAFDSCSGFTSLSLGKNITIIGESAFYACSGMTGELVIPDSVTSIGTHAFQYCSGLTGTLVIPDKAINFGEGVFYGCSGLTSLDLGNCITNIQNETFFDCSGLTGNLVIPDSVTNIGSGAFFGCSGLTGTLVISNNVTKIGASAFKSCSGLANLSLGTGITSIGASAFSNCTGLISITVLLDEPPTLVSSVLTNATSLTAIYVPADFVETYKTTSGWNSFADKIQAIQTT